MKRLTLSDYLLITTGAVLAMILADMWAVQMMNYKFYETRDFILQLWRLG